MAKRLSNEKYCTVNSILKDIRIECGQESKIYEIIGALRDEVVEEKLSYETFLFAVNYFIDFHNKGVDIQKRVDAGEKVILQKNL